MAKRQDGLGTKETLLAIGVLLVFAAVLIPLFMRSQNDSLLLGETGKMRQIYAAFAFYGQQWDGQPPLNLVDLQPTIGGTDVFVSEHDPFAKVKAAEYPADPGLPGFETSPFRISFSYIENFRRADKLDVGPWKDMAVNDKIGVLADEWLGSVDPGSPFDAKVSGRVVRINEDGSVFVLSDRGGPKPLGDPQDLFMSR